MKRFTAFILLIVMLTLGFASCSADEQMGTGASPYLDERDTTGRRIFFAEFCIEGYGKFVILLDATSAPKTVQHFGALVRQEFYNGKTFHFVNDRVLQGGCPYGDGSGNIASTLEGEFAEKLSENIDNTDPDYPHFILDKSERCPFLRKDNLCEIICTLGEEGLCQICRDHPRYRSFYSCRTEIGLGMCCEEAARIICGKKEKTTLCTIADDGESTEPNPEETEFFSIRQDIIDILQNRDITIKECLSQMLGYCGADDTELSDTAVLSKKFLGLEYMEQQWQDILKKLCEKGKLSALSSEYDTAFEQIAVYFVFRHFSKYLDGYAPSGLARFVAYGTFMIMNMCALHMSEQNSLDIRDIAEYSRMYSSEIEYSEENTERIIDNDF